MDELKVKLFEATLYYKERYLQLRKEYGDFDIVVAVDHAKFVALYSIIEECGLDSEFQEWKKRILEGEGGIPHEVEGKDPVNE
ncbi:MAG: hypothetical protein E7578_07285 [Ruminococcaceae bacterium]|nr:hypothetical protein [Oscillospiraceae bacterium]